MILEIRVPSPGESVTEVTIDSWLKADGDYVERDEPIAEIQSDKAMLTVYAEESGVLKIAVAAGTTVAVGAVIGTIDRSAKPAAAKAEPAVKTEAAAAAVSAPATTQSAHASPTPSSYATGLPSPAAERILHEKGLSPAQVQGTGRDGRITKADALAASAVQPAEPGPKIAVEPKPVAAPVPSAPSPRERNLRREKMSQLRKTLAARLVSVKNETAMLTTFNEADMSAIVALRKKYKEAFEKKHGVGLGFMSFFVKACCEALKFFPQVGAQIDGDDLVYFDYVDMGIAVSTDRGLVVPVLRNAESMSMAEIEKNIAELAAKARQNRISIADMQGGCFTITNGGVFGSLMSTPILNPPQSAILGMHKIQERPVVVDGQIVVRPMMYLALSYDHRVIDGRESVGFLVKVKEFLEDPTRLLLEI
ncbi:MAG: 2-oxoglutarate dehydrogenase complex dihydrolipoyllysine-residue succinyltransferase [Bacteroidia bacterium]|nr:2-oxoglutarate dehydrogenase complex dihydrolipoyllysine-residue succinyltransferase [Bacteroidia bacterium]